MRSQALSALCRAVFEKRDHGCFGISPFNSYFSEEKITELARWGLREFRSMHFFVPDVPAVYTLESQGYPREKAEWKARRQAQYLKNKIRRALANLSISDDQTSEMIVDWERLSSNATYTALLGEVTELFESNDKFQSECLQASLWVMNQKVDDTSALTDDKLRLAVKYFLTEIPLFAATAEILGTDTSVFCYHQRVDFLERFYQGKLSYRPRETQGFVILESTVASAKSFDPASEFPRKGIESSF
jgi:cyclo(L-tyrosyl-L-tyrosyl) synthase